MPATRLEIEIVKDNEDLENSRILYFRPRGELDDALLEELKKVATSSH